MGKFFWLNVYDNFHLKTQLSVKYLVKEWIKIKIEEQYIIKLLQV